jgi:1,4-alpha-glucan branching enzyme
VLNLTPVPRDDYRIGAPRAGRYRLVLSTDDEEFGGSGFSVPELVHTDPVPLHGREQSMLLRLPPLSALILAPE